MTNEQITVQTTINASLEKVWEFWNNPDHITKWCSASDDWHTPHAENDLKVGGRFLSRMEAKDGSMGFDFGGTYTEVKNHELIAYKMGERKVQVVFSKKSDSETEIIETFDPENQNPAEMQRAGWQAILDNFKKYVESQN